MTRSKFNTPDPPDGTPLVPAFGEIPDREQANDAKVATLDMTPLAMADPDPITPKRTRRPRDLPEGVADHLAAVNAAVRALAKATAAHDRNLARYMAALEAVDASEAVMSAALADLERLTPTVTPPSETTETANPEEQP